jgi:hypothetical protein
LRLGTTFVAPVESADIQGARLQRVGVAGVLESVAGKHI